MATKSQAATSAGKAKELSVDDVLADLRDGKPLPAGWAFNARRKPPVFRIDEQDAEPSAEAGNAPA